MPELVTLASDTFAVAQSADVDELQHHARNAACVDCLSAAHPAVCILQGGCLQRGTVCPAYDSGPLAACVCRADVISHVGFTVVGASQSSLLIVLFRLTDALPKHWGRAASATSPTKQLAEKQRLHAALLTTLARSAVLSRLPPSAVRYPARAVRRCHMQVASCRLPSCIAPLSVGSLSPPTIGI